MSLMMAGKRLSLMASRIVDQNCRIKPRRTCLPSMNSSILSCFSTSGALPDQEKSAPEYEVTFIKKNGDEIAVKGKEGDSLLDVVVNNNLDFDGYGACEGTLTCSTCHVILKKEDYDRLPDKPSEEELDMLDLAYEITNTSRLGCQIILSKDLDGLKIHLPSSINDARQ